MDYSKRFIITWLYLGLWNVLASYTALNDYNDFLVIITITFMFIGCVLLYDLIKETENLLNKIRQKTF